MDVIIMRGIPGSGKSTWVKENLIDQFGDSVRAVSADHYHTHNGVYLYEAANAKMAHNGCLRQYVDTLNSPRDRELLGYLVVDNTNIWATDIAPYYRLAEMHGVPVKIVQMLCSVEVAARRNRKHHQVPDNVLWAMWQHMHSEKMLPQWKLEVANNV